MLEPDYSAFHFLGNADWEVLAQKELGSKPATSLKWASRSGVSIDPYFVASDPSVRLPARPIWEIRQDFDGPDVRETNRAVLDALNGGIHAIGIARPPASEHEMHQLLKGVLADVVSVHFMHVEDPEMMIRWYSSFAAADDQSYRGSLGFSLPQHDLPLKAIFTSGQKKLPGFRIFESEAITIHELGAHAVQELAWNLLNGHEWLHRLVEEGVSPDSACGKIHFRFAMGSSYFSEIAKIRAFRLAWQTITRQYGVTDEHADAVIHCETSRYLQTASDVENNLLRATTQCHSAVAGGATSITVHPHDLPVASPSPTSYRLARNIQHLLQEETAMAHSLNAADGSYYVDHLVSELLDASWEQFQAYEKRGGIHACRKDFLDGVALEGKLNREDVAAGRKVVIGVNKYTSGDPVTGEKPGNRLTGGLEPATE